MRRRVPKRDRHRVVTPVSVRPFRPRLSAPQLDHVEMQMRRGAVARVAAQANPLALRDRLAELDRDTALGQVEVSRDGSVIVLDEHVILVAEGVIRVVPEQMAQIHAVLGDVEGAFAWLERGVQSRSGIAAFYSQHPDFDPLRTDPRWDRLMGQLNLR